MAWCEASGVDYLFGLARNRGLLDEITAELAQAEGEHQQTGKPVRRFKDFTYCHCRSDLPQKCRLNFPQSVRSG